MTDQTILDRLIQRCSICGWPLCAPQPRPPAPPDVSGSAGIDWQAERDRCAFPSPPAVAGGDAPEPPWQANYERQLPDRLRATADSGYDGCRFCKQSLHEAAAALERAHAARDAAERERDEAQKDAAFHADCRPNRRQAEAAWADNKALNDKVADLTVALTTALRERGEARAAIDSALVTARGIAHPEHADGCVGPEWYQGADAVLEALHEVFASVSRGTGVSP